MREYVIRILLLFFFLLTAGYSQSQLGDILKRLPEEIPRLDAILKREPAITTSYKDAVYGIPFLDDFNPEQYRSLDSVERTPEGDYVFTPGLYRFNVQSFCLHAATYSPRDGGQGDGYLYAPTKGPRADIILKIIRRAFDHPEIPQRDLQVLIWAVIAYTKLSDMPRDRQITAAKLLTAKEMLQLNDGALGLIPENLLDKAIENLPSEVGQTIKAETRLRDMLTKTQAKYEDLERIAMLSGDPPKVEGEIVPLGRWSLRPEGFYIRYFPYDYTLTRVDIYVPEIFQIEFDDLGRVVLIADDKGNRIETSYDDSINPIVVDKEHSLKAYAFRSIRFQHPDGSKKEGPAQKEWNELGWTLVGVPAKNITIINPSSHGFSDLEGRFEWAKKHQSELENLDNEFKPKENMGIIMNLSHYSIALKKALVSERTENAKWIDEHLDLVKRAWQFALWIREMHTAEETDSLYRYNGNDAIPRPLSRKQRLAMRFWVTCENSHNQTECTYFLERRPLQAPMRVSGNVR